MFFRNEKKEETVSKGNYVVILHNWFIETPIMGISFSTTFQ